MVRVAGTRSTQANRPSPTMRPAVLDASFPGPSDGGGCCDVDEVWSKEADDAEGWPHCAKTYQMSCWGYPTEKDVKTLKDYLKPVII